MKILVSDYDNTLYTNENVIKRNVEAINRFMKENIFVVATGRSYLDFIYFSKKYGINYNYLIVNYGATIIKNDSVIYNETIENDIKDKILDILELEHATYSFSCIEKDNRNTLKDHNITKIHTRYQTKEKAYAIYKKVLNLYGNYVNCYFVNHGLGIEIISKKVDKATAITKLIQIEKLNDMDIYTIGDSYSDIEMIASFNGVALSNSISEIKERAVMEVSNVFDLVNEIIK